jgi:hypothetical protein
LRVVCELAVVEEILYLLDAFDMVVRFVVVLLVPQVLLLRELLLQVLVVEKQLPLGWQRVQLAQQEQVRLLAPDAPSVLVNVLH